ncbi:MAG: hypothetical protein ACPG77_19495, partial [Nannocystaceae bacterium]
MIDQLRELIASLKARPDVIVHKARVGGPMPAAKLEGLPQHLRAFYGACNGCRLSWEFAEKKLHEASLNIPCAGKLKFRPAEAYCIA